MNTPGWIALKNVAVAIAAVAAGCVAWRLIEGTWPDLRGLAGLGAILGMSVAWSVREGYEAGIREGQARRDKAQGDGAPTDP